MNEYKVKIIEIFKSTHDVNTVRVEKPEAYSFTPGQATDVAINKPGYEDKTRPFTFTSLNDWDFLEFHIKSYFDHDGVTKEIDSLKVGDELIIGEPWGAIHYEGEGIFLAGGAGVTPFIAILRDLHEKGKLAGNKLIFANKKEADIILKSEFENILGDKFINILSDEKSEEYARGFIDEDFLKSHVRDLSKKFYLCGPPPMMDAMEKIFPKLGIKDSQIIKEEF